MLNLISQTPYPRTAPILPYSRWAQLVDANVATWSPAWIVARNSYRPAPIGRIAKDTHSRCGDAIGPYVLPEPIPPYSRWQQIIDADVEQRMIAPLYTPDYRSADRRTINVAAINQPDDSWNPWLASQSQPFDPTVVAPSYSVPDFMAPERQKINVRSINQPDTDWVWDRNDDVVAQTVIPPTYNLKYRQDDRQRLDTRSVSEPSLAWIWDRTDDVVAQTVVPLFELPNKYVSPERRKIFVSAINEPDFSPWIWKVNDSYVASSVLSAFLESFRTPEAAKILVSAINEPSFAPWVWLVNDGYVASAILPSFLRSFRAADRASIAVTSVSEPGSSPWIYPVSTIIAPFDAAFWPMMEVSRSLRSPDTPKLKVLNEPSLAPWIWLVNDGDMARLVPNLWVPRYLSQERRKLDVRSITEPEGGWVIVPITPPYVPLDPKLWPAIEQQMHAIRGRGRGEIQVVNINIPGFGWVTGYIPPVVIATGSHEKRKWRRSG